MDLMDKLTILADAAKYDAACTSSGLDRAGRAGRLGSTMAADPSARTSRASSSFLRRSPASTLSRS